jgi:hypothetical protein
MLTRGLLPSARGHAWIVQLPGSGPLGRGKLAVLRLGIVLLHDVGALVDVSLSRESPLVGLHVILFSATAPPVRLGGHGRDEVRAKLVWARLKVM